MSWDGWTRDETGYLCLKTRDICDISVADNVPSIHEPQSEWMKELPVGMREAKISISESDGSLSLFTDFPTDLKVPCDWTEDTVKYVRRACGEYRLEGADPCAERARRDYHDKGEFRRCSKENVAALFGERRDLFDIRNCKLDEVHGHDDTADLHYACTIPKRADMLSETIKSLLSKPYGERAADRVAAIAEARKRVGRE